MKTEFLGFIPIALFLLWTIYNAVFKKSESARTVLVIIMIGTLVMITGIGLVWGLTGFTNN